MYYVCVMFMDEAAAIAAGLGEAGVHVYMCV